MAFSMTVSKAPSRKTSHVLNVFQKTLNELDQVASQHGHYASQQREFAAEATRAAEEAEAEAQLARDNINSVNKALGRV